MFEFFKYFFCYVRPELNYEAPKINEPDPNIDRSLPDSVRKAKRMVIILCGICFAWSAAQFSLDNNSIDVFGTSVKISSSAIPIILAILLVYSTIQWIIEYAMMPRYIRSWHLGKIDFEITFIIARMAILALASGSLNQSIWSIGLVVISIGAMAMMSLILSVALMFITMPIRLWARSRAKRVSVANAAYEAMIWAGFFSVIFTVAGVILFAISSYIYSPIQQMIWDIPPNPIAMAIFVIVLVLVFLSHWLLRPMKHELFAKDL